MNEREYERLFQLVKLGDEEAAYTLIVEAERRGDLDACERAIAGLGGTAHSNRWLKARRRISTLRAVLYRQPSKQTWRELIRVLSTWPGGEGVKLGMRLAERRLHAWPDGLRVGNARLWYDLESGRSRADLWGLIRRLELDGVRLTSQGAERLAARPELAHLTALSLGSCRIADAGLGLLARSKHICTLLELELSNNRLSLLGIRQLSNSPYLLNLRTLDLSCNRIGDEAVRLLATSRITKRIERLHLNTCDISAAGLQALLMTPTPLSHLRELNLACNTVSDEGASQLAQAPSSATLERLTLSSNDIHDVGVVALARSKHLGALRVLDLRDNPLSEEAISALAKARSLESLERLEMTLTGHARSAARALLRSSRLPRLQHLNLGPEVQIAVSPSGRASGALENKALRDALAQRFGNTA